MNQSIELASNATTINTVEIDNAIMNNNGVIMNDQWFKVRRYAAPSYDAYQNAENNNIVLLTELGSVYTFLKEIEPTIVEVIESTEKNIESNTPNGLICRLSDGRHLWVAMMSTSSGKALCYPMGLTHMEIFKTRDCCFMDNESMNNSTTSMINELIKVSREAYALQQQNDEEVSIGTEALIYDEDNDLPVDGYVYADYACNEGNCGTYHSIKWLEDLIEEMKEVARGVHIKDAQEARDIVNELFMSKEQTMYYEFLCMDAFTTTQDKDMDDTCRDIFKYVNGLSNRQCIIEFQQELMSDYEMELLEDEARDMAMNEPDLEDLETRVTQIMGDLLYTKGK